MEMSACVAGELGFNLAAAEAISRVFLQALHVLHEKVEKERGWQ